MTAPLRVEAFGLDAASRLGPAWAELATRSLEPSVFSEPAFLLPAARYLANSPLRFFAAWAGSNDRARLVGLHVAVIPRVPVLAPARAWLHPQATNAYPVLDRDLAGPALDALLNAVGRLAPALVLSGLDQGGPTAALVRASTRRICVLDERTRAVLFRTGHRPGLDGKARKELRRQWKRLGEGGLLAFRSVTAVAEMPEALARFFALEALGWKGRRGTALGSHPGTRAFAETSMLDLARIGHCRVDSLERDGRPIAMGIVLRSAERAFFWKTAFDEEFARASPGMQLAIHLSETQLHEPGLELTDSCAVAGHSMIDRLWPDRLTLADVMVDTRPSRPSGFGAICTMERHRRAARARAKSMLAAARNLRGR